jgi:dTDP-glucose pyrophosphorylase
MHEASNTSSRRDWRHVLVPDSASIMDAVDRLDRTSLQIVLVVTSERRLVGTVTDGDVRRGLLRGVPLSASVLEIANCEPATVAPGGRRASHVRIMRQRDLRHLPVVHADRSVAGLVLLDELLGRRSGPDTPVVIMAGGLGNRLRPLTEQTPKPLLTVGGRPILETLLERLADQGFQQFHFAVRYKAAMIRDRFGDGRAWGVRITYLEEEEQLGTAGALRLLAPVPTVPVLVVNGDLMTNVNAERMLEFHEEQQAVATMGVREYEMQIPYGVVTTSGVRITLVEEKPMQRALINGGIYCLSPAALAYVPASGRFDMTDLFRVLIAEGMATAAFPIHESWLDVGRPEDLARARDGAPEPG